MASKKSGQKSVFAYNNWDTLIKYDSLFIWNPSLSGCPIYLFESDNSERTWTSNLQDKKH